MKPGSAQTPVVHSLFGTLSNGLNRTSPEAIAKRYEGIAVGCEDGIRQYMFKQIVFKRGPVCKNKSHIPRLSLFRREQDQ